ncbi:amphi-Trp domain-containing protein [Halohasta litchfieldiae]|jgi:amphi-Trp domain-containing protein|uniref:Amphi-Trp domain-containing protein n=1 Tax=Halohasta litchfieldiae TaxID=1073996 RepID=A0A1H6RQG7_9EURY|nr:amphi-Trp domain-containing protein [Halohasta litchfieldiae]ATW89715.1 amphi-Trp domain-containing protein [Halohasta litchfieldiae]SEI53825.1 amphi-Trp domain-containing protein [Halohasta litchfieldiae]
MAEETLIEVEGSHDRATIASYFRQFADGLEADGSVTFSTGEDEVSLTVPETAEFEIEVERETEEEDDEAEYEIEFEVGWSTDEDEEAEAAILEIGGGSKSDTEGQQETIDEAVDEAEGGHEAAASDERAAHDDEGEAGSDAELESPDPPDGRSEVDAAEDDEGSRLTDTDTDSDEDR